MAPATLGLHPNLPGQDVLPWGLGWGRGFSAACGPHLMGARGLGWAFPFRRWHGWVTEDVSAASDWSGAGPSWRGRPPPWPGHICPCHSWVTSLSEVPHHISQHVGRSRPGRSTPCFGGQWHSGFSTQLRQLLGLAGKPACAERGLLMLPSLLLKGPAGRSPTSLQVTAL